MKTVEEIYNELLERFTQRSGYDLTDSCDLAVRLYAAAAQIQALLIQADWVLDQSFPQTAEGTYLDSHATMRGLDRTAAAKATGTVRFSVRTAGSTDLTVESGTVCQTATGVRVETVETVILTAGETSADAAAMAVEPGLAGNVAAGTVTMLTACPVGITGCTNPAAFTGGSDQEPDEALRERIIQSYRRLPNGANAAFYETTAMGHEGVTAAKAVGRARGIGTVDVYIATAAGLPSAALLAAVQADLAAKREIAVDVLVKAPTPQTVNVAVEITAADFAAAKTAVETAVGNYFTGSLMGKPVLLAELGKIIYAVDGVGNYHITTPAADTAGNQTVLPVLGTLTVTKIGEGSV